MNKIELIISLKSSHQKFINYIDSLNKEAFELSNHQKWTAVQELEHIIRSTFPISKVLKNKEFIASKFGSIDRDLISYEELVEMYHNALAKGGKAFGQFIPDEISWAEKDRQKDQLMSIIESIVSDLEDYSEDELTKLTLIHPLLGKLTIEEMMFFTIYHVEHHMNNSLRNLQS